MSKLASLKACNNLTDLAILLGLNAKALSAVIHDIPDKKKYKPFSIPKRSGGVRQILAPIPELKIAQRRLSNLLSECFVEVEGQLISSKKAALSHGFLPGRSIITNAKRHRAKRFVFNIDIEDFFPSINFGRVLGFFLKNKNFLLQEPVAIAIAQISCHPRGLPQGSPCSPIISNLIAHVLDIHLHRLCARNGCSYSRYADDITISTNKKEFPPIIAVESKVTTGVWAASDGLRSRISRAGFRINNAKTRMAYRDQRQEVTGITVNRKVNVSGKYYKALRIMCRNLFRTGKFFIPEQPAPAKVAQLRGMLNFMFLVRGEETGHRPFAVGKGETDESSRPGFYLMYKRFLDYYFFYGNDKATIICEGKTDNVYIASAIKSLIINYPSLAVPAEPHAEYAVRFFKYSNIAKVVQNIGGGTGDLSKIIYNYDLLWKRYSAPGGRQPVIMIVDNDSGSAPIWAAIKKVANLAVMPNGSERFYYVARNLYVVPIPKVPGSAETVIEDLFDAATLSIKINGKTFNPDENSYDGSIHYNKATFAEEVEKRRKDINFAGFTELLDRIVAVQEHLRLNQ